MENDLAGILKRLQRKGASALELLPVYQHGEYESLWRGQPDLHRAFVRKLIDEGHPTRAFELAREGLARHAGDPELTYLVGLALARGGNISAVEGCLTKLLQRTDLEAKLRIDAVSLEGRLYKDRYERSADATRKAELAARSAAAYRKAADILGANYFPRINAATMALLSGDSQQAKDLARTVIEQVEEERRQPDRAEDYWGLATLGEACLLLGRLDEAATWYQKAVAGASERGDVGSIASMRRNALLLREKLAISDELMRLFYMGSVVVFSGHMLDSPTRVSKDKLPPRFPADPQLIREVSGAIKEALADLNATIGFCSAACGSDILFAEQMLERHAELHIVLPFARGDFYSTSVDFASPEMKPWRVRFDALLERAKQVHYATTEAYLGDDVLFDFVSSFTQGLAIIRAKERGVIPQALAVLDAAAARRPGGTACFLDSCIQANLPVRVIDLAGLREGILGSTRSPSVPAEPAPAAAGDRMERQLKCMLFADVKDFSKIREEHSPQFFMRFLHEVDDALRSLKTAPTFSNTWGDGLYLVFDRVADGAQAAIRLLERAEQLNWKDMGLAETTPVRIGIHAGPVFSDMDPIIRRRNYFGSHVNRAARIEPVTMPGCAFTSEQFAALLAMEPGHEFVCEYIGVEPLAKQYDWCPLYRLTRR
jgi:class 3 adenylate cyclase